MQEGARVDWFPGKVVVLKTPIFLVLRGPRLTTEALKVLLRRRQLARWANLVGLLAGLLWEKNGVDVWQDTTAGDGDGGQELAELLVVPDGELDVPWDDPGLLVVPGGVSGQLEDLGGEVLKDGGEVDWSAGSDSGGVLSGLQIPADPSDGELESSLGGLGDGLLGALSLSSSRRGCFGLVWFGFCVCGSFDVVCTFCVVSFVARRVSLREPCSASCAPVFEFGVRSFRFAEMSGFLGTVFFKSLFLLSRFPPSRISNRTL